MRVGDADVRGPGRAQCLYGQAVAQELVVGDGQGVEHQLLARRVGAERVAEQGVLGGFVEGDPLVDAVAETVGHEGHVLGEPGGGVPLQPVQRFRQVPVEERRDRTDARRHEFVHETVVEVEAALGAHPRPGHREAVRVHPQARQQGHVLAVAVVVVAGHRRRRAVLHPSRFGREGVPHGSLALVRRTLDLVGRGGDAPQEAGRETRDRMLFSRHAPDHGYRRVGKSTARREQAVTHPL